MSVIISRLRFYLGGGLAFATFALVLIAASFLEGCTPSGMIRPAGVDSFKVPSVEVQIQATGELTSISVQDYDDLAIAQINGEEYAFPFYGSRVEEMGWLLSEGRTSQLMVQPQQEGFSEASAIRDIRFYYEGDEESEIWFSAHNTGEEDASFDDCEVFGFNATTPDAISVLGSANEVSVELNDVVRNGSTIQDCLEAYGMPYAETITSEDTKEGITYGFAEWRFVDPDGRELGIEVGVDPSTGGLVTFSLAVGRHRPIYL